MTKFEKIKSIDIDGAEVYTVPNRHVKYQILVKGEVRSWAVWKRYSEFDALHKELSKATGKPIPMELPPKTGWFSCVGFSDEGLIEDRKLGFEAYLRCLVLTPESKWRDSDIVSTFLQIPSSRSALNDPNMDVSSEGWLIELKSCQNLVREIRAILIKRENEFSQRNLATAHQHTAEARKQSLSLNARLVNLEKSLTILGQANSNTLTLTSGELLRRRDLLEHLHSEKGLLNQLIHRTHPTESTGSSRASSPSVTTSDRGQLLNQPNPTRSRRVFGSAAVPAETKETRALDNEGLLQLQKAKMEMQDQSLDQFSRILQRQHLIGTEIGNELALHNKLLEDLDNSLAITDTKIKKTNNDVKKIN